MFNFLKRYDRLAALIFGAVMTFSIIYMKFNNMMMDTENLKNRVTTLVDGAERVTVFMERQVLVDQRQNEILNELKDQMHHTWRSR